MGLLNLFPILGAVQTAPGPQGEGLHGSGSSTHLWFKQTSPELQSGSLTHSGPHPVMVSGLGIIPGTQLQMALPTLFTVQMVLGPQGVGWQGLVGALVVRFTKRWIGDRGAIGIRLDLNFVVNKRENIRFSRIYIYLGGGGFGIKTCTGLRGRTGTTGCLFGR